MELKSKQSGFTLIELMVVIAIMGIMVALAAPSFSRMMAKSEVQTIVSEWRNSFFLAQKEAIRSKHRVTLCPSNDGINCNAGQLGDYSGGWIVLDQETNPPTLIQDFPPTKGMVNGTINLQLNNNIALNFLRNGRLPNNFVQSQLQATHTTLAGINVALVISTAGNITVN